MHKNQHWTTTAAWRSPTEIMNRDSVTKTMLEILRAFWVSDRSRLLVIGLIVVISSMSSVGAPYLFSLSIDNLSKANQQKALIGGLLLYPFLLGLSATLQRLVLLLAHMSAERIAFVASTGFFERILRKTTPFFVEFNPAEIQSANAQGRAALTVLVQLAVGNLLPGVIQIGLTLITFGTLINLRVTGIVTVYGAVVVALTYISARRSRVFLENAISATQQSARFVGGAIAAMETLRYFGSHRWLSERFLTDAQEVLKNWSAWCIRRIRYAILLGLGITIQFSVTFWMLMPRFEAGLISVGDLVLFNILLLQLNAPFETIARTVDELARIRATFAPFASMWSAPEEQLSTALNKLQIGQARIVFENVGYIYANGRGVDKVSFVAERGSVTFLTGKTGSGKSTIFKLGLKALEPTKGRILVDGIDLSSIERDRWHETVAVVPQDCILLNETLEENILLGRPRDVQKLREAAARASILPFIESLPEGFRTTVGERGLKLSGGERQRIAIARALYCKPDILFLDEASSALDEATEREIIAHVRSLAHEVTVLAITHRQAMIQECDNLVLLDGDKIETGVR
jgi:ATP-binding cassette, subfamily B, bacterial